MKNQFLAIRLEAFLCKLGILRTADWDAFLKSRERRLYAGFLPSSYYQADKGFFGITPFQTGVHNIAHDLRDALPIPDGSVSIFQAEDVFEHIPVENIPAILAEIHRVLEPGGLFRFSVPDYNFSHYKARTEKDEDGKFLFDPGGGGELVDGEVKGGGHVWFPTIDDVTTLFDASPFSDVHFRQYYDHEGNPHTEPVDHSIARVSRSAELDPRGAGNPVSIIVDATK